ncbi:MAG: hypothetical protein M0T74_03975 [Desulfitobacterium hafniense]|nr:hypothetical protein [Desulfitobacterium hafniense]
MLNFSRGTLWAGIITAGLAQLRTTSAHSAGQINSAEYGAHTTKNVTGALGLMAGLEYGAMLGSAVMPGVGTVLGTIVGGVLGDRVGNSIGMEVGNLIFNNQAVKQLPERAGLIN